MLKQHPGATQAGIGQRERTEAAASKIERKAAYRRAPGHLRRQWNQALFERLLVHDDRIEKAEVAEPFATLTDPDLPQKLDGTATRAKPPPPRAAVQMRPC